MLRIWLSAVIACCTYSCSAFGQDFSHVAVERVAANLKFAEGPVWSRDGFLLFSDGPNNKIMKFTPGEGVSVFSENTNGANGNTFDEKGRLYSCESRTGRVIRTDKKGKVEVLAEKWEGKRLNAPNDIVVSKNGHVYFTDPAFGDQADHRQLDFFGVFLIGTKGELSMIAKPSGRPNGIALSPNGKILYITNSDERNIRAYDVDKNGAVENERVVVAATDGIPDGLKVDEKGNLWVMAKGLTVYAADGKQIAALALSEKPSNCAFGDPDFQTLYVTARTSVFRLRLDVKGAVQY
jgi:gluconolactonase